MSVEWKSSNWSCVDLRRIYTSYVPLVLGSIPSKKPKACPLFRGTLSTASWTLVNCSYQHQMQQSCCSIWIKSANLTISEPLREVGIGSNSRCIEMINFLSLFLLSIPIHSPFGSLTALLPCPLPKHPQWLANHLVLGSSSMWQRLPCQYMIVYVRHTFKVAM